MNRQLVTMDEIKISITCIENLSDELFYKIFDYLDACHIYEAFSNLNLRFQHLLTYSSFSPKLNCYSMLKSVFEYHCKQHIIPNRHKIFSIHLWHPTLIDVLLKHNTIDSSYKQLQSIVLHGIKSEKLLKVLSHLIYLPRLVSLTIHILYIFLDLNIIYQQIFRLPFLKYNQLSFISSEILDNQFILLPSPIDKQQLSSLEHLKLGHYCTINELISILFYTPRLSHLTCRHLIRSYAANNEREMFIGLPNLIFLSIENCDLSFDKFENFIKKISYRLHILRINASRDLTYLDAKRWERLIREYIPYLSRFYFDYNVSILNSSNLSFTDISIKYFMSPFWLARRWLLEMKLHLDKAIFSIHPYKKRWDELDYSSRQQLSKYSILVNVTTDFDNEIIESHHHNLRSIFDLLSITVLDVDCHGMPADRLNKLINLIPTLNSLKISSGVLLNSSYTRNDDDKNDNLHLNNNLISKVYLEKMNRIIEVQFLIDLCPHMSYFEIDCTNNINLELFIQFILIQNKKKNSHLCCLCLRMLTKDENMMINLENMIDSHRLLNNYTIKWKYNRIYLQWQQN